MDFSTNEAGPVRRYAGVGSVTLLHVLAVYALITGLAHRLIDIARQPLDVKMVEQVKIPPPEMKPPPAPKLSQPTLPFIPPPEVPTQVQQETAVTLSSSVPPRVDAQEKPKTTPIESIVAAPSTYERAKGFWDACIPAYPRLSMEFEEEGTVRLQFDIGPDGKARETHVIRSSGHPRLDKAAIAALSACPFKAAIRDGVPVSSTLMVDYVWSLSGN
jgi:protein TonB